MSLLSRELIECIFLIVEPKFFNIFQVIWSKTVLSYRSHQFKMEFVVLYLKMVLKQNKEN